MNSESIKEIKELIAAQYKEIEDLKIQLEFTQADLRDECKEHMDFMNDINVVLQNLKTQQEEKDEQIKALKRELAQVYRDHSNLSINTSLSDWDALPEYVNQTECVKLVGTLQPLNTHQRARIVDAIDKAVRGEIKVSAHKKGRTKYVNTREMIRYVATKMNYK